MNGINYVLSDYWLQKVFGIRKYFTYLTQMKEKKRKKSKCSNTCIFH